MSSGYPWAGPPSVCAEEKAVAQVPARIPFLSRHCRWPWEECPSTQGMPWKTTSSRAYREGGWSRRSHQSAQTFFWVFLGGQFLCMFWERHIALRLLCQALGFWSYFRGCLGAQGQLASRDGMGRRWHFCHTLLGRLVGFVFCILPLHKPKSLHLVSTVWTAPALARGISGGRSPSPGRGKAEMLRSRFLRHLGRAGPSPGRRMASRRGTAYILQPGQGPKPHV